MPWIKLMSPRSVGLRQIATERFDAQDCAHLTHETVPKSIGNDRRSFVVELIWQMQRSVSRGGTGKFLPGYELDGIAFESIIVWVTVRR
ncbi:hypothetical protein Fuma_02879 [Fuerstiella marisgermanici]|uniref:Uncharacterized protein n=1 Tax=Fuerstiella marisgermanici TaxID=1891926 RepID=A0A1P8WGT7_9PLAN|nr:hypothetical protein Fuma_02879 [Fuerstiella marisgermanici]